MSLNDEHFVCPKCGHDGKHSAPTYRQVRCGSCGHRGDDLDFDTRSKVECRNCSECAPYQHSDRRGDVHVCKNCGKNTVYPMDTEVSA